MPCQAVFCSFSLDGKGTEKIKARIIGPRCSRPKAVILMAGSAFC